MKITRIRDKKGLEETGIIEWGPIDYSQHFALTFLADEDKENLSSELYELLIDEYQLVKVRTEEGKKAYLQAVRGQCDDREGRSRTDEFEYVPPLFDRNLVDGEAIEQLKTETGCSLWGVGFEFGYEEVLVPWCNE
tara:strand:+ start:295 stop:702 length:408 start_codon:yes stop_codon:yes gene_type:complete